MKVFKYQIEPGKMFVAMPYGAKIIHVAEQGADVFVWAEVIPHNEIVGRRLLPVMTGGDVPSDGVYVGTAHPVEGGATYVVHVYDCGEQ